MESLSTERRLRSAFSTVLPCAASWRSMNGRGEETRIVGGAVRNALLGRPVTEVDCATTALPDAIVERGDEGRVQGGSDRDRSRHGHRRSSTASLSRSRPCARTWRPTDAMPSCISGATSGRCEAARLHHQRPLARLRRAASRLHRRRERSRRPAASASSAMRIPASARITCGSCASSASMREYAEGGPDPEGLRRCREPSGPDSAPSSRRSGSGPSFLRLLVAPGGAGDTIAILADHGFLTGASGRLRRSSDASIVWRSADREGPDPVCASRRSPS